MDPIGLVVLVIYAVLLKAASPDLAPVSVPAPAPAPAPDVWSADDARRAFLRDPNTTLRCKARRATGEVDEAVIWDIHGALEFFEAAR